MFNLGHRRGFNRTKSSVVLTEEMNPDQKSLRQYNFYETPGWPSEEPIYESIDSELYED